MGGSFVDAVGQQRNRCLIYAERADGPAITGLGTIDGNGPAFGHDEDGRPFMIRFVDCSQVRVQDVTLRDSPGWVSHYLGCENVCIQGVTIRSHTNGNNDGIDLDSCRGVRISGLRHRHRRRRDLHQGHARHPLREHRRDRLRDPQRLGRAQARHGIGGRFSQHRLQRPGHPRHARRRPQDHQHGRLRARKRPGQQHRHGPRQRADLPAARPPAAPVFRRPAGTSARMPARGVHPQRDGRVWEEGYPLFGKLPRKAGIIVTGVPGHDIEDVSFENIDLTFPGGGSAGDAARHDVPEQETEYPEFPMFHPLPAWGFYLRHARNLRFRDVRLRTEQPDARPAFFTDDVRPAAAR